MSVIPMHWITMGGERKGAIDHLLERQGLHRRIALRVPHFVAALALVAKTDLLLTVPYGLAKNCASHYGLVILPFPMAQKAFTYSVIWHERYLRDPGHQWLRQLMVEELTRVAGRLEQECPVWTGDPVAIQNKGLLISGSQRQDIG